MYGLFADWFQEASLAADELAPELGGGAALIDDMLDGAETYLQLWERAVYGGNDCVKDGSRFQVEDLHALLGNNVEGYLRAIGQPVDREGSAYVYCVEGADGEQPEVVEVIFDDDGNATDVEPSDRAVQPDGGVSRPDATRAAAVRAQDRQAVGALPKAGVDDDHAHATGVPDDHAHDEIGAVAAAPAGGGSSQGAALAAGALVALSVLALAVHALLDRRRTAALRA
jgi:hypothetical protein